jgi:L-ascorbate metabolism protein UlaG (beta-lactamase superfamily)
MSAQSDPTHGSSLAKFETDVIPTAGGDLRITFLGHGSLLFVFQGQNIYVDPFGQVADYSTLPRADVVLITHEHRDHLDAAALGHIRTDRSVIVLTETCAGQVAGGIVMRNGESRRVAAIPVEAVPAYNVLHRRGDGQPFHPRGIGNGYVLTFGDQRVYVAGDTENIPEMKQLTEIACAFLPMNLPYTMTPEMVADAARAFRPRIVYPYHYGDTDTTRIVELLKAAHGIEVRIRRMA